MQLFFFFYLKNKLPVWWSNILRKSVSSSNTGGASRWTLVVRGRCPSGGYRRVAAHIYASLVLADAPNIFTPFFPPRHHHLFRFRFLDLRSAIVCEVSDNKCRKSWWERVDGAQRVSASLFVDIWRFCARTWFRGLKRAAGRERVRAAARVGITIVLSTAGGKRCATVTPTVRRPETAARTTSACASYLVSWTPSQAISVKYIYVYIYLTEMAW